MIVTRTIRVSLPITGEQLRFRRVSLGVSVRKFSKVLRVTPSYWSKVERGIATPSEETLERAVCALWGDGKVGEHHGVRQGDRMKIENTLIIALLSFAAMFGFLGGMAASDSRKSEGATHREALKNGGRPAFVSGASNSITKREFIATTIYAGMEPGVVEEDTQADAATAVRRADALLMALEASR